MTEAVKPLGPLLETSAEVNGWRSWRTSCKGLTREHASGLYVAVLFFDGIQVSSTKVNVLR